MHRLIGSAAVAALAAAAIGTPLSVRSQNATVTAAVKAIDSDCLAIQYAITALHPIHVALVQNNWKVLSDADYTEAEQTRASMTLVNAWKAGQNYAWISSNTFDANGKQHATQLCFRQSDGTLERARQAKTIPRLNRASAQAAYFASDGTLIYQVGVFDQSDPVVSKTVKSLPYYSILP
jgi:hypothetical protein